MKTGYALVTAAGWPQCDTDDDFGFAATVDDVYLDYNKAYVARDKIIENDKEEFTAEYAEDGEEDRVDFSEDEVDEVKYVQFLLDGRVLNETKYYIKPVYIRD